MILKAHSESAYVSGIVRQDLNTDCSTGTSSIIAINTSFVSISFLYLPKILPGLPWYR